MKNLLLAIIIGVTPILSNAKRLNDYTTQNGKKLSIHLIGQGT